MFKWKSKNGEKYCPDVKGNCIKHDCHRYQKVVGTNKNTGEAVDHYDCAENILIMLTIENSSMQQQTGAAIESFRNEMVKGNAVNQIMHELEHKK